MSFHKHEKKSEKEDFGLCLFIRKTIGISTSWAVGHTEEWGGAPLGERGQLWEHLSLQWDCEVKIHKLTFIVSSFSDNGIVTGLNFEFRRWSRITLQNGTTNYGEIVQVVGLKAFGSLGFLPRDLSTVSAATKMALGYGGGSAANGVKLINEDEKDAAADLTDASKDEA
ncbi:hypothetical protein NHQ30_007720 [Ciborinia camelliae]|nr:hypothetical protein NHQ30_007720 [Ciborinia camelliae]